jgi:hypothetical protein
MLIIRAEHLLDPGETSVSGSAPDPDPGMSKKHVSLFKLVGVGGTKDDDRFDATELRREVSNEGGCSVVMTSNSFSSASIMIMMYVV